MSVDKKRPKNYRKAPIQEPPSWATHALIEYESDFLEPGYKAVCMCGWKSDTQPDMQHAAAEHNEHVRDQEPQP